MNIFVGNLAKEVTDEDLQSLFSQYGTVRSVKIIKDMFTGESRGFGFIEMPGQAEAQKAMTELNTRDLKGKKITVNEARERTDNKKGRGKPRGGSRDGGSRGGGGKKSW